MGTAEISVCKWQAVEAKMLHRSRSSAFTARRQAFRSSSSIIVCSCGTAPWWRMPEFSIAADASMYELRIADKTRTEVAE